MMRYAAAVSLFLCLAVPALAQVGVGPGGGVGGYGGAPGGYGGQQGGLTPAGVPHTPKDDDDEHAAPKEDKPAAPPPAIPGAEPDENAAVAPADKLAAEMSPNDALFDAITRGDLAAAKDALNRGAQLDARNVLGQTPTDASIDLDRNDITFLLLSMRTGSGAAVRTVAAATPAPAPAPTRGKKGRHGVIEASARAKPASSAAPVPSTDRGTPNPTVGFIGF